MLVKTGVRRLVLRCVMIWVRAWLICHSPEHQRVVRVSLKYPWHLFVVLHVPLFCYEGCRLGMSLRNPYMVCNCIIQVGLDAYAGGQAALPVDSCQEAKGSIRGK